MTNCIGFPAVGQSDARILILGSLPGVESLKRREYYAKKQNCFWRIMGELVGASPDLPYEERLNYLKRYGIALWDVCASAYRIGSLDSHIERATLVTNDFDWFFKVHKNICLICFNGQAAEKLFSQIVLPTLSFDIIDIERNILPSTSPAHARMPYADKLYIWQRLLKKCIL